MATMNDPEFVADVRRNKFELEPEDGEHLSTLIKKIYATPKAVIDRLAAIDDRAGPIVRRLGTKVEEFGGYRPRLRHARTQVEDGERDWFTSPRIDSYHTVWMELHEHLLLALGLDRADESAESHA